MKVILLWIYVFGVCLQVSEFRRDYHLYKKYKSFVGGIGFVIFSIVIWPIIWLSNFIKYYLDASDNYKK